MNEQKKKNVKLLLEAKRAMKNSRITKNVSEKYVKWWLIKND